MAWSWDQFARLLERPEKLADASVADAMRRAASALHDPAASNSTLSFDTYVINLDGSHDRLEHMAQQFDRVHGREIGLFGFLGRTTAQEFVWRRVPAVHGDGLNMDGLLAAGLVTKGQAKRNVGSGLSHLQVWAAVANRTRAALVMEDDVILRPLWLSNAESLLRQCEEARFHICSLTWFKHLTRHSCVHSFGELVRLRCAKGLNTGVTAYFISPEGAQLAISQALPLRTTIDLQLGRQSRQIRWFTVPAQRFDSIAAHDWSLRSVRVHGVRKRRQKHRTRGDKPEALVELPLLA